MDAGQFPRYKKRAHLALEKSTESGKLQSKRFNQYYRLPGDPRPYGGVGRDEMVRTSTTRRRLMRILPKSGIKQSLAKYQDAKTFAGIVSHSRIDTDKLVWYSTNTQLGSHPGALRKQAFTTQNIQHGHGPRDRARAKAVEAEFDEVEKTKSGMGLMIEGGHHMAVRGQVETVRTMMSPFQEFNAKGAQGVEHQMIHPQFGDVKQPANFNAMARSVHNARETLKWQTASQLLGLGGMDQHVPPSMSQYLQNTRNSAGEFQPLVAKAQFDANLSAPHNTSQTSQAGVIGTSETLRGTNASVGKPMGRKRALSDARRPV